MNTIFLDNIELDSIRLLNYKDNPTVLNYLSYGIIEVNPWFVIRSELILLGIV